MNTPHLILSHSHCAVSKLKPNLFALVTLNIDSTRIFAQTFTLNSLKNGTSFVCVKVLVTEVKALDFTLYHLFLVLLLLLLLNPCVVRVIRVIGV